MPSFKTTAMPSQQQVEMEKDENGFNILTLEYIKELCEANGQYTTPVLNDTLYLHFKGFSKIQNLDAYTNLKSIWLEGNGISQISGLENLTKLKVIFLQQNQIHRIENLNHLKNLVTINLSQNYIKKIEGLVGLNNLENLDLHGNIIPNTESCEELLLLPKLANLDLKDN